MTKRNVSVYIDDELLKKIDLVARVKSLEEGIGRSELIEEILSEWISRNPSKIRDAEEKANDAAAAKMTELAGTYGFSVSTDLIKKLLKDKRKDSSQE